FCEVSQRAGQPVDLVDDHHVDPTGFDIRQHLFESGALEIAPGIGGIVIMLGQGPPALRRLTLYIGLTSIPLSVERIELLLQAMLGGFAGVNGATEYFGFSGHRQRPGRGSTAAPRTADRSSWCR